MAQLARRLKDDKCGSQRPWRTNEGRQAATHCAQQIEEAANEQAGELARAREESAGLGEDDE